MLVTGLLLMFGLLLLLNPEFAATRWPWELNGLDARIVAAWALGWAVWCGTMAFAVDWDEIRTAARLFVLLGIALTSSPSSSATSSSLGADPPLPSRS